MFWCWEYPDRCPGPGGRGMTGGPGGRGAGSTPAAPSPGSSGTRWAAWTHSPPPWSRYVGTLTRGLGSRGSMSAISSVISWSKSNNATLHLGSVVCRKKEEMNENILHFSKSVSYEKSGKIGLQKICVISDFGFGYYGSLLILCLCFLVSLFNFAFLFKWLLWWGWDLFLVLDSFFFFFFLWFSGLTGSMLEELLS